MSTIAEAEGFDMLRWRESLRKSCYETTDVKVINGIAEDFVDMVRYLDGEVNDTLQWVEGHLPVDKKLLASKRWMCKFHQIDMEELSVEGEGIAAAKERALKLFLVVGYMASALKDAEELRANAEKSLKEKELASKRWTYEIYIMNMAMFTVAMFVAIGDRASKLISVVSKATEGTLRLNEIAKLRRELSSAKKIIIALTLEVDDKQKTLDACLQRESELRQRETRSKRRKGDLATRVATTARRRGSRGDRVESDKDTADESDIDTTRYPSSSSVMLDDFDVAGSEEGTHAKVVDKGKASEASLGGKSALQQKIAELETKLRTTRNKRSKRRKGDLARRVANTVGGFRVERTGSDKIPSSSAEARPANLDSCAPEDRTQVEGEQPDVSVMGCCSGVPSAKTHIQHGFTREMGRIGASALGSSRLPRVLIWDAILKEQQRRCGEGNSDDGKNEVGTNFLPRHNHHEHLHREGTIHDIFFG